MDIGIVFLQDEQMLLTHGAQQRDIFLCDYMPFFKFRALVLAGII